jgi:hypothetical protein
MKYSYEVLVGNPLREKPFGRPRLRMVLNFEMCLREVLCVDVDEIIRLIRGSIGILSSIQE